MKSIKLFEKTLLTVATLALVSLNACGNMSSSAVASAVDESSDINSQESELASSSDQLNLDPSISIRVGESVNGLKGGRCYIQFNQCDKRQNDLAGRGVLLKLNIDDASERKAECERYATVQAKIDRFHRTCQTSPLDRDEGYVIWLNDNKQVTVFRAIPAPAPATEIMGPFPVTTHGYFSAVEGKTYMNCSRENDKGTGMLSSTFKITRNPSGNAIYATGSYSGSVAGTIDNTSNGVRLHVHSTSNSGDYRDWNCTGSPQ